MTSKVFRFDQEIAVRPVAPGEAIAEDWRVKFPAEATPPGMTIGPEGLRLDVPAETRSLFLFAPVAIPVECERAELQISIALRSSDPKALKAALNTVSLLRLYGTGRQSRVVTFAGALARQEGAHQLRLTSLVPWPFGQGQYMLELRFNAGQPPLGITRIALDIARPAMAAPPPARPGVARLPAPGATDRLRVAVLTWEVGDNPFGRAHLLAEMFGRHHAVELAGSTFARPPTGIWEPLRDSALSMRYFPGGEMREFLAAAQAFARTIECDVVHVSKARLPGLIIALLVAHRLGCPILLDLDDHELSFFGPAARPIGLAELEALSEPPPDADFGKPERGFWTGVGEGLVPSFAHRTVANIRLAERFGGRVVRHARDERLFRPDPVLRASVRRRLGITEADRVILFAGTPRRHKGLERLLAAVRALEDPRLLVVVIGTIRDRGFQRELERHDTGRIRFLPDIPFSKLPEMLQVADGVCLLQDETSPITQFQTPAKLSDALSLGVPVAMTPVPTVTELGPERLVTLIRDEAGLRDWLGGIAAGDDPPEARQRRLGWFEAEFSQAVNGARLELALAEALDAPPAWHPEWSRLFIQLNRHFDAGLPEAPPAWAERGCLAAPALRRRRPMDLVCFWKQNDTGIYGRRHDMLLKYLRESEQVGTIIQFDAPIRIDRLRAQEAAAADSPLHHGKLIADATARRFLELDAEPGVLRRTFVYARERGASYLGRALPREEAYADYVRDIVARHCSGNIVGWGWPVAPLQAEMTEALGFDLNVIDLVDDQRTMATDPEQALRVEESYRRVLARADLVFANCAPVRDAFAPFSPQPIHVVPNAGELYGMGGRPPRELEGLEGPVIGYVGNLRARIDIALLEELVTRRPGWTFVVVGSAHDTTEILRLRRHRNLRLLGPRVYEEALACMRRFDVAIMPHLRNAVSERMNPLKLYVYVALGIPVVSSDVANIDDLRDRIQVATDSEDFLARLDAVVTRRAFAGQHQPLSAEELWPISWPKRVAEMLALCQRRLAG